MQRAVAAFAARANGGLIVTVLTRADQVIE
jgi:hypothetical protein